MWGVLLFGSAFCIGASRWLTPSPSGVGTHEQLGLPPCGFLAVTGKPCPACGLTTAFAHLAHLELVASLRAHPVGLVLFALCLALLPSAAIGLARGSSVIEFIDRSAADRVSLGVAGALLLTWAVRLMG